MTCSTHRHSFPVADGLPIAVPLRLSLCPSLADAVCGRPRLERNPVGRPRTQNLPEENPPREFNEPGPRFTGDDRETPLLAEDCD
jgi:hypothetical protein